MPRPKKLSDNPVATVLTPEDEARFESERLRRGITRSELAREKIEGYERIRQALDELVEHCKVCGRVATRVWRWSDRENLSCEDPRCIKQIREWYDGDHEYDKTGLFCDKLNNENVRIALENEARK